MPMSGRLGGLRESLTGRTAGGAAPELAEDEPQRVVTVLGMHRSGTSSLVGSLEAAGLPLGEVRSIEGDSNQKGHREPGEIIKLHDDVLMTSGGAWHLPPAQVSWSSKQRARRDEFISAHSASALWGWKEPRTLLVVDGWLEVLPQLEMVGTFRHPAAVARSLQRRHGSDTVDMWLELWLAYNRNLLDLVEARDFPLIDFDLPAERYRARLGTIIATLGLQAPAAGSEFFDASLRTSQRQTPPEVTLPLEVERVYTHLVGIAGEQATG